MFTFGREREKKSGAQYVRDPDQTYLLMDVIDAVHDLIENKGSERALIDKIRVAFTTGGAGVWQNAGVWLRKCSGEHPQVLDLWKNLATSSQAEVRFRVACFLNEMPSPIFTSLSAVLSNDKSRRVSDMAKARTEEVKRSPNQAL